MWFVKRKENIQGKHGGQQRDGIYEKMKSGEMKFDSESHFNSYFYSALASKRANFVSDRYKQNGDDYLAKQIASNGLIDEEEALDEIQILNRIMKTANSMAARSATVAERGKFKLKYRQEKDGTRCFCLTKGNTPSAYVEFIEDGETLVGENFINCPKKAGTSWNLLSAVKSAEDNRENMLWVMKAVANKLATETNCKNVVPMTAFLRSGQKGANVITKLLNREKFTL